MNAEIISVGTELLLGHTINTDAAFVARELSAIGVNLLFACTVGDNPGRLRDALEEALGRSDVVITTGGLGPTDDDLTKETIASVAGAPLKIHEDSLRRLESYFKGRPAMGENQRKQAMLPEGATVFPNDIGTAPGCGVRTASGKVIVMLPGPPSELVPMLQHYVVPFLKEGSHAVIHSCMIRTFGLGEGAGALKIADLTDAANPTAATYAKENEMFVRVTARAESEEAAEALCRPVVEEICRRYGDVVYGVDVDNLYISQPDNGEQALEITETMVRSGAVDIVIVDSVAALVPKAEIDGDMGDSHVGLQARLMSQALRKLTAVISRTNCIVIFINQLREKVGVMFGNPETTTGGRALKFYSSVRLDVRRTESLKQSGEVIGNHVRVKVVKNKIAPPFKEAEFDIMFGKGISREGDVLDLAADANIVEKSGSWYAYKGAKIGQGRENAKQYLAQNPLICEEIENQVRELHGLEAQHVAAGEPSGEAAGESVAPADAGNMTAGMEKEEAER